MSLVIVLIFLYIFGYVIYKTVIVIKNIICSDFVQNIIYLISDIFDCLVNLIIEIHKGIHTFILNNKSPEKVQAKIDLLLLESLASQLTMIKDQLKEVSLDYNIKIRVEPSVLTNFASIKRLPIKIVENDNYYTSREEEIFINNYDPHTQGNYKGKRFSIYADFENAAVHDYSYKIIFFLNTNNTSKAIVIMSDLLGRIKNLDNYIGYNINENDFINRDDFIEISVIFEGTTKYDVEWLTKLESRTRELA